MASTLILQRRIRSIKNAKQITKAMEVVAASRLRKVAEATKKSQAYSDAATEVMRRVATTTEAGLHPYFRPVENGATLYIIMTSDKGLAGAFNANVINSALKAFVDDKAKGHEPQLVVIGVKGNRYFARFAGVVMTGAYEGFTETPNANNFAPIIKTIEEGFGSKFTKVVLIYTKFFSTLRQQVQQLQILPVALPEVEAGTKPMSPAEYEPDAEAVLARATRLYFESQLMQGRIDSVASEYAMKMVAMGNANKNAGDLIDNLTLELNATRQAAITQEIAEITGGAAAIV